MVSVPQDEWQKNYNLKTAWYDKVKIGTVLVGKKIRKIFRFVSCGMRWPIQKKEGKTKYILPAQT